MNFTKEYIKECDCKEIQGLKQKLDRGDWCQREKKIWGGVIVDLIRYVHSINEISFGGNGNDWKRKELIWLPTGDQLDDEIVKIFERNQDHYEYYLYFDPVAKLWWLEIRDTTTDKALFEVDDMDILLAKIKLLKALLKEEQCYQKHHQLYS